MPRARPTPHCNFADKRLFRLISDNKGPRIGGPFAPRTFAGWFRRECDKAGLPHCSAHGLRKAAARRLAEAGCTAHEIGAITGHASLTELARYTKAADQRRLAEAAMAKTRTSARKPAARFAKKAGKVLKIKD
jgi:integrase